MKEEKAIELLRKYSPDKKSFESVLTHSRAVQNLALEWAGKIKESGYRVDINFVKTASLLHDIGAFKYPPWSKDRIKHGIAGAEILRKEGFPKHARICEVHIGAGLTKEDIEKGNLPLPPKNYVPITIEEKIITCADNLIEGGKRKTIEWAVRRFEREVGKDYAKKVYNLYKKLTDMMK